MRNEKAFFKGFFRCFDLSFYIKANASSKKTRTLLDDEKAIAKDWVNVGESIKKSTASYIKRQT